MTSKRFGLVVVIALAALLAPSGVNAHFVWMYRDIDASGNVTLKLSFAEGAISEGADFIDGTRLGKIKCLTPSGQSDSLAVTLSVGDDAYIAKNINLDAVYSAEYVYGLFSRGDSSSKLFYYSLTGPALENQVWKSSELPTQQKLVIVPRVVDTRIAFHVFWNGKPLAESEISLEGPKAADEGVTNEEGICFVEHQGEGRYELRAKHVEATPGELDGEEYSQELHYCTLVVDIGESESSSATHLSIPRELPHLPFATTSFGAFYLNDQLYVYGGHHGEAHHYSADEQGDTLFQFDMKSGTEWKSVDQDEGMQGLALLGHGDFVYRIGGLQARNETSKEHDLWSTDSFHRFSLSTKEWESLPPLPEPRSSFDASLVGDTIYVVGGWKLAGPDEQEWLTTAYAYDLGESEGQWKKIADPAFTRRAIVTASHDNKLYVVGGMSENRGPTTNVSIYDPATDAWSEGPNLPGDGFQGFGSSAATVAGRLYATTMNGNLHCLSEDGESWTHVGELTGTRFFHRMLSIDDRYLLLIGGADMEVGKFDDLEWVDTQKLSRDE